MTRVAVLRALGLGDLLIAVPALRALRRALPDAQVVLGAPGGLAPLVELVDAVDVLVPVGPYVGPPPSGRLPAAFRGADLAVNLHGAGPQSTRLLRATGPGRLLAYGVTSTWDDAEHEVRRWCRLLDEAGLPADPADLALRRPAAPSPAPGAVVVHPGAAYRSKRWPTDRWAVVARALRRDGHRVVLTGSPAEVELASAVAAAAGLGGDAVLAGRTPLPALAALVADAALVLCGDTGVAHLATAYGTPSVVLFGPTSPARWGPPAGGRHRVLWAGVESDPFAEVPAPGLLAINVGDVLAAADALGTWAGQTR